MRKAGTVAQASNSSYSGGRDLEECRKKSTCEDRSFEIIKSEGQKENRIKAGVLTQQ
jgi:hypothetical protein